MSNRASVWLALIALLWGCSTARQKPDEPEVKSLHIEGTHQVSEGSIKDKILTEATSWLPFSGKKYFDPNAWQVDLRRIQRFYQAEGFYQAKVVENVITPKPPDGVELTVKVQEGKPTRINRLEVEGIDALPADHRKQVLSEIKIKVGDVLKEDEWEALKGQLQSKLHELGYAEASVGGEIFVDVERALANGRLNVDPGQRYRFGDIVVATGPRPRVPTAWIKDQAEGAIKKGNWFSESALAEAQNSLFKMGVFGGVKVTPAAPNRQEGTLPVVVDVREAPFHSLRLGGGIGVDQIRNELHLLSEYTDRDFLGGLRRLTLRARVGWAFIPNLYSVLANITADAPNNGPIYKLLAQLEQPRFFNRNLRLYTSIDSEKGLEQAYSFIGARARVGVIWQPHPALTVFPTYNIEIDWLSSGQATLIDSNGAVSSSPALLFGCPNQRCQLSYLEQQITWDRRDDRLEPQRGYYLSISFQEGGGPLGGTFRYLRVEPDARFYASFFKGQRLTLAARVHFGSLFPAHGQTSPIVSRFYAGGAASERGFNYRRLSPLFAAGTSTTAPHNGFINTIGAPDGITVPIGGNGLAEGSFEIRYNITGNLLLAAFWDMGFVTVENLVDGWRHQANYFFGNMQYAVGLGLRYRTIVGPIRLDIARRLPIGPPLTIVNQPIPVNLPPPDTTCFGIGFLGGKGTRAGSPESVCAFHISIGEAF